MKRLLVFVFVLLSAYVEAGGAPPGALFVPSVWAVWPDDGTTGINPVSVVLDWGVSFPNGGSIVSDLYFGNENSSLWEEINLTESQWGPIALDPSSQYFWQMIGYNGRGGMVIGPEWTFTTGPLPAGAPLNPPGPNAAVPEPTTMILLGSGLLRLLSFKKRR